MSRQQHDDGFATFLLGLVTGLIGGVAAGILLAPKSGEETREDINAMAKRLPEEFKAPNGKAREFIDRTKANIESQVTEVKHQMEAGKQAKAKRAEEMASGYELN